MRRADNKRMVPWALVAGLAAFLAGCVNMNKAYPINRITSGIQVLPLHRSEYQILSDTEGEACAKFLLGGKYPWFTGAPVKTVNLAYDEKPGWFEGGFAPSIPLFGWIFGGKRDLLYEAVYNALEKVPGADSLLSVRIKFERRYRIPPFYSSWCVNVKGKAFQIKTDGQGGQR